MEDNEVIDLPPNIDFDSENKYTYDDYLPIEKTNQSLLDNLINDFNIKSEDIPEITLEIENDNLLGLLDEDENLVNYKSPIVDVGRDILEKLNMNFTINDLFVEKPYKIRKYKNKDYFFLKQIMLLIN